jgi:hypothetical protein
MKRLFVVIVVIAVATTLSAQSRRSVLIRAAQPYDALVATIEQAGWHRYQTVQAREWHRGRSSG